MMSKDEQLKIAAVQAATAFLAIDKESSHTGNYMIELAEKIYKFYTKELTNEN